MDFSFFSWLSWYTFARLNTALLSFGTITYLPLSFISNMLLTICVFLVWAPHPLPISLLMYCCSSSFKVSNTSSKCRCLRRFLRFSTASVSSWHPLAAAVFLPTFTFCNYVFQGELARSPSFGKQKKYLLQKIAFIEGLMYDIHPSIHPTLRTFAAGLFITSFTSCSASSSFSLHSMDGMGSCSCASVSDQFPSLTISMKLVRESMFIASLAAAGFFFGKCGSTNVVLPLLNMPLVFITFLGAIAKQEPLSVVWMRPELSWTYLPNRLGNK